MDTKFSTVFFGSWHHAPLVFRFVAAEPSFKVQLAVTGGDETTPNPIRQLAQEREIPVAYWNTKKDVPGLREKLQQLEPDFLLVSDFGHIIPKEILEVASYGAVNVHPSLLPKYRGTAPVQTAILNGDSEVGVSLILMDEKMDHGPLLAQARIKAAASDTAPVLYEKLFNIGAKILPPALQMMVSGIQSSTTTSNHQSSIINLQYFYPPQLQDESQATYTKMLKKEDGKIDWTKPPVIIERMVRAYAGWPGAWTTIAELRSAKLKIKSQKSKVDERRVKILKAHLQDGEILQIDQLQIEGKKPVGWAEFARGYL